MCLCIHVFAGEFECGGQKTTSGLSRSGVFSLVLWSPCLGTSCLFSFLFLTRFLTGLKFTKQARLAGQGTLGNHLSPQPQHWDYKCMLPHLIVDSWDWTQVFMFEKRQALYSLKCLPSLSSPLLFLFPFLSFLEDSLSVLLPQASNSGFFYLSHKSTVIQVCSTMSDLYHCWPM